jgi:hypothetical protein
MNTEHIINLKILAEKFNHKSDTYSNSIDILSNINRINIKQENESNFKIRYNLCLNDKIVIISKEAIYDFIIKLFKRQDDNTDVLIIIEKVINIEEWFKIEKTIAENLINEIQTELNYNYRIKSMDLKSPRFDVSYFNGILILEDKSKIYLSNIFEFKKIIESKMVIKTK